MSKNSKTFHIHSHGHTYISHSHDHDRHRHHDNYHRSHRSRSHHESRRRSHTESARHQSTRRREETQTKQKDNNKAQVTSKPSKPFITGPPIRRSPLLQHPPPRVQPLHPLSQSVKELVKMPSPNPIEASSPNNLMNLPGFPSPPKTPSLMDFSYFPSPPRSPSKASLPRSPFPPVLPSPPIFHDWLQLPRFPPPPRRLPSIPTFEEIYNQQEHKKHKSPFEEPNKIKKIMEEDSDTDAVTFTYDPDGNRTNLRGLPNSECEEDDSQLEIEELLGTKRRAKKNILHDDNEDILDETAKKELSKTGIKKDIKVEDRVNIGKIVLKYASYALESENCENGKIIVDNLIENIDRVASTMVQKSMSEDSETSGV